MRLSSIWSQIKDCFLLCRPQTWARKQALRIVAERDAAYAEALAKGEVEEEVTGDVVMNWKPLM